MNDNGLGAEERQGATSLRNPWAPWAGLDNILVRVAPPSLTYWLHQLLGGSLLGLAQAATENGQEVKPDIGVAAEATAQETAEFP